MDHSVLHFAQGSVWNIHFSPIHIVSHFATFAAGVWWFDYLVVGWSKARNSSLVACPQYSFWIFCLLISGKNTGLEAKNRFGHSSVSWLVGDGILISCLIMRAVHTNASGGMDALIGSVCSRCAGDAPGFGRRAWSKKGVKRYMAWWRSSGLLKKYDPIRLECWGSSVNLRSKSNPGRKSHICCRTQASGRMCVGTASQHTARGGLASEVVHHPGV